jgi:GAF domain-containing protein/HAMP domain-containing protein
MTQPTLKIKPRFQKRLVRKSLAVFLVLLALSTLFTVGSILLYLYLFLPAGGIQQDAIQPFLLSLALQSLGVLIITLLLSGLIYLKFSRSIVQELVVIIESMKAFTGGEWIERITINRNDEVGMLANQFNLLAEELTAVNRGIEKKVEESLCDIETTASIMKLAASGVTKQELLQGALRLLVNHFGYHGVSIYLVDETGQYLVLTESYPNEEAKDYPGKIKFRIGSQTIIGWVGENLQPQAVGDVSESSSFKRNGLLIDTLSEAALPVIFDGILLGVLNIQSKKADKFGEDQITSLVNITNLLGVSLRNIDLQECSSVNIEEAALLFNISQKVAKSETIAEIFQVIDEGLGETEYYSIILTASSHSLEVISIHNPELPEATNISDWPLINLENIEELLPTRNPIVISDLDNPPNMPGLLLYMLREWQVKASAFIPVSTNGRLAALFIIAVKDQEKLPAPVIQPFANLAILAAASIQKINALQIAAKRQNEVRALQIISEAVAGQTTMSDIYTAVHKAIQNIIGDVNFLIALYDQDTNLIQIPYVFEGDEVFNVDPFPLGEGLTSILIKTQQPLMLVHDTERRTRELGAKIVGAPPKSWLGVPMILRGEVLGALIIQDLETEGRFTEDDQQLLLTAAVQVGSAVQSARFLEQTTRQADREKLLHEITKKIRRSTDMRTILATTASEIGRSLGVSRTSVEIFPDSTDELTDQHEGQPENPDELPGGKGTPDG